MKPEFFAILAAAAMAASAAVPATAADDPDAIVGIWETEQKEPDDPYSHVEIFEREGRYAGRIIWLSQPLYDEDDPEAGKPRRDRENSDEELRDRPIVGLEIMHGFRFDEDDGNWVDGRIYDPENGKEYRCKVTRKAADSLEIYGYVKLGFIKMGRSTIWKRVAGDDT